jgi:hypothetical protein
MKTPTQTTLQKLVLELMAPQQPAMSDLELTDWRERLPGIRNEVFSTMRMTLFGGLSGKIISRHLQQIQKECTLMLDALYHYPDFPERMLPLFDEVVACLEEILKHQRLRYDKYLDPYALMPIALYRAAAKQIEAKAAVMVSAMCRYYADKTLQSLIIGKMTGLLQQGSGSWHQVSYLEKLQVWIMELCTGRTDNITRKLKDLLLRANFNTSGFMNYCKTGVANALAERFEEGEQYECLYFLERDFSMLTYKKKAVKFERNQPKTRELLLDYVRAELAVLNKKYQVVVAAKTGKDLEDPAAAYRLPVAVSVDVLAYFFRLLLKVGVITCPKSELLVFMVKNFQTPRTNKTAITLGSVESKYRQVVKSTAVSVGAILLKMVKVVDEEFG